MRAFLCSIGDTVWDAVEVGWTRSKAAKSTWDKAALTVCYLCLHLSSLLLFISFYCCVALNMD